MKTQKPTTGTKKGSSPKPSTQKDANLKSINLGQFKKELDAKEFKELQQKDSLYKYPDGWTRDKINSDEGKKWRNNKRNKLKSLMNNILFYAKSENMESLKEECKKFHSFYKDFYLKNDLSLASLSSSRDDKKNQDILLGLKIIREIK